MSKRLKTNHDYSHKYLLKEIPWYLLKLQIQDWLAKLFSYQKIPLSSLNKSGSRSHLCSGILHGLSNAYLLQNFKLTPPFE
jgi:hypothetical protein